MHTWKLLLFETGCLRQENHEFEAILPYMVKFCIQNHPLKWKVKNLLVCSDFVSAKWIAGHHKVTFFLCSSLYHSGIIWTEVETTY